MDAGTRAAKRDFWTSPRVSTICKRIDYAIAIAVMLTIMLLGSLNF